MTVCLLYYLTASSYFFFFSSRRRHTRLQGDWSSDVCSSDLLYWRRAKEQPELSPWSDNKKRLCQKPRRSAWRERSDSRAAPDRWQQFRKSLRDRKFPPAAPPGEK